MPFVAPRDARLGDEADMKIKMVPGSERQAKKTVMNGTLTVRYTK